MIVDILDAGGRTTRVDATRVRVRGGDGKVFMFAVEYATGIVYCSHAGCDDFRETAAVCGIDEIPDVRRLTNEPGLRLEPTI